MARFCKQKAAIKLDTQFDVKTDIPHFVHFNDASVHDVKVMKLPMYEVGSFYFLTGYVDFERLYDIHQQLAWFVIRPKANMNYRRLYSAKADKEKGITVEQTIKLNNHYAAKDYPEKLRLITF